jgi:hypothetical protein
MEAQTQAGQSLEARLEKYDKKQLIEFANGFFGVSVDPKLTKKQIYDKLLEYDRLLKAQAAQETAASAKKMATEDDPLIAMKFTNLDFPKADLELAYDSGRGIKPPRTARKPDDTRPSQMPRYRFVDGETYEVPYSVFRHLNSLQTPDPKYQVDPVSNLIRGVAMGLRKRFACELLIDRIDSKTLLKVQELEKSKTK